MKKIASFMALCIICTGLSVVNASNVMQGVSSNDSTTETSQIKQTAHLAITGFSFGNDQAAMNVVVGILTEYEGYENLSMSVAWEKGAGVVVVIIRGPKDYVLGALDFLSSNKPGYLTIDVHMTFA